jgi:eukaryotic-like serine/threonine-protein kinase
MNEPLILDRYRLVERLAVGGSAEVWRAHDEQLDRSVAIKRLHPHLLPDEASRQRLVAEARAAARLSHPGIAGIYDVDATGEIAAIVMELVDGESLAARIERAGPLPEPDAVRVTAEVAEALYHAHQQGVVHRDVKPGNVLLGADSRTRLVDFGIAHSLAVSAERLTLTGTVVGTLHSMAPEQLIGGPITPRTDLYGLGVVLHEALTGRHPYPAATPVALADAQRAGPPSLEGIDPTLAAVIAACLAHDPAARPLHAGALADALRAWLAGDPSPARFVGPPAAIDTGAVTEVIPAVDSAPLPAAPAAAPPPRGRRRLAPWPLGAVVALAGLVLVAAIVLGNAIPGTGSAASPSPTAFAATTPTPEWLAGLLGDVVKHCGDARAAEVAPELEAMSEEQAAAHAEEIVDACKDENRGGGNGRGRGGAGDD